MKSTNSPHVFHTFLRLREGQEDYLFILSQNMRQQAWFLASKFVHILYAKVCENRIFRYRFYSL